jgi:hypothetical protein
MIKYFRVISIVLFFLFALLSLSFAEDLTITTYYPSPYGSYNNLYVANNVGIGTPSPQEALDIALNKSIFLEGNSNSWGFKINVNDYGGGSVPMRFIQRNSGTDTEVMRILQGGNIGIGTTNPTYRFTITDQATATIRFGVQSGSNNLYAYGGVQSSWSDARLKNNVQPQRGILEKIMKVNPVTYNWKEEAKIDSKMHYGVIAQELVDIFPTLVYEDKDGHLNVQRDEMQFILVQAVKEQQQEIEALKSEIQALKEKIK